MSGRSEQAGIEEVRFWLTRVKPGWLSDDGHYAWPDFQFEDLLVTASKEPDPCRLCVRIMGLAPQPIELDAPCPTLIDSPFGIPGVEVRVRWRAGRLSLCFNGKSVAEAAF